MKWISFLLLVFPLFGIAQEEVGWDVYMAQYEGGPGSVVVNMSLRDNAPYKDLPFRMSTGVKYKRCLEDGFPTKEEFEVLYKISDSVKAVMYNALLTGTFTHACERLDYYYMPDTAGVRAALTAMYKRAWPGYEYSITITPDAQWEAYLKFLYPNEEILEYMGNQKVVMKLQEAGDQLVKERQVDHWLYFTSDKDRNCFITYATAKKYKVESKANKAGKGGNFSLQISRTDKVDLPSINQLTLELRKQAKGCRGNYDGWETFVIKD